MKKISNSNKHTCLLTTSFGVAPTLGREISYHGFKTDKIFGTGVYVDLTEEEIAHLLVWIRTASTLWMQTVQTKKCTDFDDLYQLILSYDRSQYIGEGHGISISCNTHESELHSERTIQSVAQKAIMTSLTGSEDGTWKINKKFPVINIRVNIAYDACQVFIDCSGAGLHERGWRTETGTAPLKEHIAAALVLMTSRGYSAPLIDPYCGSGTIPIEAALIASNRAPGLQRSFACEDFPGYKFSELIDTVKNKAKKKIYDKKYDIKGFDMDLSMVKKARINAKNAGVGDIVKFEKHNTLHYQFSEEETIITNPPYGNRIDDKNVARIHDTLFHKARYVKNMTIISGYEDAKDYYEDRFRDTKPIKNGAEECTLYFHRDK